MFWPKTILVFIEMFFETKNDISLSYIIFSNNFENAGSKLMGR